MELMDTVVVITGGSKGLGKSLAIELLKHGAKVTISGREAINVTKTAMEIGIDGVTVDVTNEVLVAKLANEVMKKHGRIDIWINNAGVRIPHGPVEELDMKRFHEMMETNLFGMVYGSKVALLAMKPKKQGTIVNILSTSALDGRPNLSAYAASKFAALGFFKSLRPEVAPDGIKVINVYPGGMRTNFFDEQKPADYDQYMDPVTVAKKIVANLMQEQPEEELMVKRPKV